MADAPFILAAGAVELLVAADGKKTPTFTMVAYSGGLMSVSGFGIVALDLAGADVSGVVPILVDHDQALDSLAGQGEASILSNTIVVTGRLTEATSAGSKVIALARSGITLQASVGFAPDKREFIRAGDSVTVNGRKLVAPDSGLTLVRSGRLREVSLLSVAADSNTSVSIAASAAQKGPTMENEFVVSSDTKDMLLANFRSSMPDPAIEAKRLGLIECWSPRLDASAPVDLQAKAADLKARAVAGEISLDQLRLGAVELLRAERPTAPAIHSSRHDMSPQVIEASFCKSLGLANREKVFRPEVLEAADSHGPVGLQELLLRAAGENGYPHSHRRISSGNLGEVIRAGFSTVSLGTMLSSAANKILLEGFSNIPQTWRIVARTRTVNDFKQVTAYRMTDDLEYEQVAPAGEIPHGTLSQESYTLQAKTYAKMLVLTRQDIINDDLGAFDSLRARLGMGSAKAMNKLFWTMWVNNSTFFTGARANYQSGGTTTLAETGLNSALQLFRALQGEGGTGLDLEPAILLSPPDLEATNRQFYASQEMRSPAAAAKFPVGNIFFNRFRPEIVSQLSSASYTGYSITSWFLLCDPKILATADMCFLNGQESPAVESTDADFNTLGIQFRGYHDFGCSMSEWRAGVKSAGA